MKKSQAVLALIVVGIAALISSPSIVHPISFKLSPPPSALADYVDTETLPKVNLLWEGPTPGPEGFAAGEDNVIYAGLLDGRIISFDPDRLSSDPITIAFTGDPNKALPFPCGTYQTEHLCGRPLGLEWDAKGKVSKRAGKSAKPRLIIADAYLGLLSMDTSEGGSTTVLTTKAKGDKQNMKFLNDLEIADNGVVYMTDSSERWHVRDHMYEILEARPTGRVLQYDAKDGSTSVITKNLSFPNGLLLEKDEESLLVAESTLARILRVFVKGEKKGKTEVFLDNLACIPDNLMWADDKKTSFWIGCATKRVQGGFSAMDFLADKPFIRDLTAKILPQGAKALLSLTPKIGLIVHVDIPTKKTTALYDPSGKVSSISTVFQHGDFLYLGSPYAHNAYIAQVPFDKKVLKRGSH